MALADRKQGDAEQLEAVHRYNDRLEKHVQTTLAKAHEKTEELIADNPRLSNVLNRFCLCDSNGQHKLPREKKRLGITDTVEVVDEKPKTTTKNDYSIF